MSERLMPAAGRPPPRQRLRWTAATAILTRKQWIRTTNPTPRIRAPDETTVFLDFVSKN